MKIALLSLLISSVLVTPAFAYRMHGMMMPVGCMQENASINVNFNLKAQSFTDAKAKFDAKIKEMEEFVKEQHVEKFVLQSMNYNVNSQRMSYGADMGEVTYQLNGNASYQLPSADAAFKLGEFLTKQGFTVNVNVNRYGNGPCPDAQQGNVEMPLNGALGDKDKAADTKIEPKVQKDQ